MISPDINAIREQVSLALIEDLGGELNAHNDITANLIDESENATATIITREQCVICGVAWVEQAFALIDERLELVWQVKDGDTVAADTTLLTLTGSARAILTAERVALNFLQTLSATATVTASYAKLLAGSNTKILDTRKTLPGLRMAQKYAVHCGGGQNHRIGLFDAFLIKENHIFSCGSIEKAISRAKEMKPGKPVEVEVESLEELQQALLAGADIVMLDNFTNEQIQKAVALTQGQCKLEVSGNITDERLSSLATLGVDYISSGALTKNVKAIDLSLRVNLA
ncbi:carboxylating nicotinate-nucleotide diphosphorylase [Alteromonas naphthalenivorans]|jgi:nicotinate-nucleotide pyrophosphorylase (carboxylating)|uniref:Probable nicotinate-nucleotide pyrophosphorylase [carboxylating] n=1 Tax=Alteromonas naphthalenivorans TaxID=715451 RepID=F5ZBT3_ALTNA|nr:carboxylating nicotinate-nucleotide diphosphorylase [Alteromonas naphthalenivorans]AEF02012.1 nicotinate-nucleotide pyrophosphorylase [Alteromonas naphthalenivorans]|tara:strand:- start:86 stop:940 length:855 start_codon:yes stop_codon:yes gene_type:complete